MNSPFLSKIAFGSSASSPKRKDCDLEVAKENQY
jgi:hypothetical protein